MRRTIFISYSSRDKNYCDELLPALQSVADIRQHVWRDREEIGVGDHFHPKIQEALADARLAIVLLSNHLLTSRYVMQHELPVLLRLAASGELKLGFLYVSAVAEAALKIDFDSDGRRQRFDLGAIHSFNTRQEPLDIINETGLRNLRYYTRIADWADHEIRAGETPQDLAISARTTHPTSRIRPQPNAKRHDLAIFITDRTDHWQHQFFPGAYAEAIKPDIACLPPAQTLGYLVDGKLLFQLLFGSDPATYTNLFSLAFDSRRPVEPSYAPLRVRLFTDAEQLLGLPWQSIAYQGRPLAEAGWTVEFQAMRTPAAFPEYVEHVCRFPARLLLAGSAASLPTAHFDDLQRFFQRHWPANPATRVGPKASSLRGALQVGSTRLLYYCGPAASQGLLLDDSDAGECLSWDALADDLQRSQSVSLLFLNLIGGAVEEALVHMPRLLAAVKGAVLCQCNPRAAAPDAARAGMAILDALLVDKADPVVALHRYACGQICAWTRYTQWRCEAPKLLRNPDLVTLLLDRHRQRDALAGARDEFFNYPRRRIHHVVALGTPGCRTQEFPSLIRRHLVDKPDERVVYYEHSLELTPGIQDVRGIDELLRRRLRRAHPKPLLDALLGDPQALIGTTYCFLVLGWQAGTAQENAADQRLLRAVADWCRTHLAEELAAARWQGKVRVLSIVALEAPTTDALAATVDALIDEYADKAAADKSGFHFAELDALSAVTARDLRRYFDNEKICGCDDRYRARFPELLLGGRQAMPFDEAVSAIRRGEPDNWGSFFTELGALTQRGDWPPPHYSPNFWSLRDAD